MPKHFTYSPGIVYTRKIYDAITADKLVADAVPMQVAGARAIAFALTEGGTVNNRSGVLTIYVSVDGGTTFFAYNKLITNAANSISEGHVRVGTVTRAAAGTDLIYMDPETLGAITHIKAQIDITDGASPTGNFTLDAVVTY